MKKAIKWLVMKDLQTNGKVMNFIIATMCFLGIVLLAIISLLFITK